MADDRTLMKAALELLQREPEASVGLVVIDAKYPQWDGLYREPQGRWYRRERIRELKGDLTYTVSEDAVPQVIYGLGMFTTLEVGTGVLVLVVPFDHRTIAPGSVLTAEGALD